MESKGRIYFVHFDPFGCSHFPLQGKEALINKTAKLYITVVKHKHNYYEFFSREAIKNCIVSDSAIFCKLETK